MEQLLTYLVVFPVEFGIGSEKMVDLRYLLVGIVDANRLPDSVAGEPPVGKVHEEKKVAETGSAQRTVVHLVGMQLVLPLCSARDF